jgi:hypothetical protein
MLRIIPLNIVHQSKKKANENSPYNLPMAKVFYPLYAIVSPIISENNFISIYSLILGKKRTILHTRMVLRAGDRIRTDEW